MNNVVRKVHARENPPTINIDLSTRSRYNIDNKTYSLIRNEHDDYPIIDVDFTINGRKYHVSVNDSQTLGKQTFTGIDLSTIPDNNTFPTNVTPTKATGKNIVIKTGTGTASTASRYIKTDYYDIFVLNITNLLIIDNTKWNGTASVTGLYVFDIQFVDLGLDMTTFYIESRFPVSRYFNGNTSSNASRLIEGRVYLHSPKYKGYYNGYIYVTLDDNTTKQLLVTNGNITDKTYRYIKKIEFNGQWYSHPDLYIGTDGLVYYEWNNRL